MRFTKHLVLHTTSDISKGESILRLVDCIERVLEFKILDVRKILGVSERVFGYRNSDRVNNDYGFEHLRFGISGEPIPRVSIRVTRLTGSKAKSFLKSNGLVQNDVRISFTEEEFSEEVLRRKVIDLAIELASIIGSSFCYLADSRYDIMSYDSKSGLEVGLKDAYWLMMFGEEYQAMPKFEKLLNIEFGNASVLDSGHWLVRATSISKVPDGESWTQMKYDLKSEIGLSYFCDLEKVQRQESGVFSPWAALKVAFSNSREFVNEPHKSKITPRFDYSMLYGAQRPDGFG